MNRIIFILTILVCAYSAKAQFNPGHLEAWLTPDCRIAAVTSHPSNGDKLTECRFDAQWFEPGYGQRYKVLSFVNCDADTIYLDLPNLPANISSFKLVRWAKWEKPSGTTSGATNKVTLPTACIGPTLPTDVGDWKALNQVVIIDGMALVTCADPGTWTMALPDGMLLGWGNFSAGTTAIPLPANISFFYLYLYFFHNGEVQVITQIIT